MILGIILGVIGSAWLAVTILLAFWMFGADEGQFGVDAVVPITANALWWVASIALLGGFILAKVLG